MGMVVGRPMWKPAGLGVSNAPRVRFPQPAPPSRDTAVPTLGGKGVSASFWNADRLENGVSQLSLLGTKTLKQCPPRVDPPAVPSAGELVFWLMNATRRGVEERSLEILQFSVMV